MLADPSFRRETDGIGVAQFGADRPQVAQAIAIESPSRFDRDVLAALFEFPAQFGQGLEDHWLAAGEDHVFDPKVFDLPQDFLGAAVLSLGFPRSIAGIAVPAAQIATAGPNEDAGRSGQKTFSLNALKNLGNPYQSRALCKWIRRLWRVLDSVVFCGDC